MLSREGYCHISAWFNLSKSARTVVHGHIRRAGWGIQFQLDSGEQRWYMTGVMDWQKKADATHSREKTTVSCERRSWAVLFSRPTNGKARASRLSAFGFIISRTELGFPFLPCGPSVIKLRHQIWGITFFLSVLLFSLPHCTGLSPSLSLPLTGSLSIHFSLCLSFCHIHTYIFRNTHTHTHT